MKIRSNLVYNKHTEELIGFLDLADPQINYNMLEDESKLATYVLCFYLRGIATNLKYSFAHFATSGATATQMFPLFWEAVSLLQFNCNSWVIAATSDGASSNRKLFRMLGGELKLGKVVYKTRNIVAAERWIYLFSDVPHLIKTCRNSLLSSGSHIQFMWKDNQNIVWQHIDGAFYQNLEDGCKLLPKLTLDHINLTPYSKMTVKYAAQVLSRSVSNVLNEWDPPGPKETTKFCRMIDSFFDLLNVRCLDEDKLKGKPFLRPFDEINDISFDWLKKVFLPYFENWKQSSDQREGREFSDIEKAKMFLPIETYEGLKMTTYAVIECVKFLLGEGMEYLLTERFCQDPAEEYFGHQRMLGRRTENAELQEYMYNANTIRVQKEFSLTSGNTRGRYDRKRSRVYTTDDIVKKRKRNSKQSKIQENLSKIKF